MVPSILNVAVPSTTGVPGAGASSRDKRLSAMASKPFADAQEICSNWNARSGSCKGDGPCINGRTHRCSVCGGSHRACDKHSSAPKGNGKGKGKKGKGKKGQKGQKGQTPDFEAQV